VNGTGDDPHSMRPRPRADLVAQLLDDELVVYDATTRTLHHLNASATIFWTLCDGARTVDEIIEIIAAHTDGERTSIERDADELMTRLTNDSLIVVGREPDDASRRV
jgi:hypothetical protein